MQIKSSRLVYAGIVLLFLILTAGISLADDVNVELVGHFGGIFNNVVVAGNYAYIGQGHDLVVLDITDVNKRSEVGRVATPSVFNIVAVSGNCAYVIGEGVLSVVDISNPSLPTLTGSYDTADYSNGIAVSGNYAYVTSTVYLDDAYESRLEIVDITNPSSPTLAGSYYIGNYVSGIAVSGNSAYVAGGSGLAIIDISNPASPTLAGSYDTADYANGIAVSGNSAYLTDGSSLVIVDISNPSLPTFGGSCDIGTEYVNSVAVVGNYVYLTAIDFGLIIVNVTNPSSPKINGIYMNDFLLGAVVSGNYAYAVDYVAGGLYIVDISNPSSPFLAGSYGGYAYGIAVSGNYAYVACDIGLEIVDISNPSSPTLAGSYGGSAENVAISGNYAYATIFGGLYIVDISNPSSPFLAGSYGHSAVGVAVADHYAYVAGHDNSLVILDISNPASPTIVGSFDTLDYARDVAVSGNYAYVADSDNGLVILDISDPSAPTLMGNYDTGFAFDVAVSGNYAYVADSDNGLVILDISDSSSPFLAGSYGGSAHGIAVSGNYAYVAGGIGLEIVDISNPSSPTLAGSYYTVGGVSDVAVSGNYAYVADGENGLVILRVETVSDTIPPASVTNLKEARAGQNWIRWTWVNPTDADFSHVIVYVDNAFVTNTSDGFYNATGLGDVYISDLNLKDEWVRVKNLGSSSVDLTGWEIKDEDDIHTYIFPSFQLKASATVTLYTAEGVNTGTELYWGSGGSVWNNEGDTAYLYNSNGNPVDSLNSRTTHIIEGRTHTINTRTVDTSGNLNATWVNDSATTTVLMISGLSGKDITASSITLTWTNSPDISIVEIYRNNGIVGNVTGFTSYVDSNLNSATSYNYTLIPYNINGLQGKAVSISLKTASPSGGGGGGGTSTKKSSGGGGGGGAGSAEDFANVAMKDVDSEYLRMNSNVTYEFMREGDPIQSVSFYSLKNSGQITSTIEVLNNRSKLVSSGPEGLVYKYVNIWVGKSGFATAANIKDGRVKFKVSNSWIKDMGVSPADVKLQRFNGTAWEVLPTTMDSNTTGYTMFEARTPGFSPFAITAERAVVASVTGETGTTPIQTENVGVEGTQPEKSRIWTFVMVILIIGVFAAGYEYLKRQQGVINMGLVKTILKWLLIIFVVLVLLGIFLGGPSDQPTKSTDQQQQTTEQAKETPTKEPQSEVYSVGDRVVVGDIAYTVTNARMASSIGDSTFGDQADGIFVIVDMKLENLGKETITMSSSYVKAIDSQGRVFESDSGAWIYLEDNLLLKQLQPGLPTNGQAVFDVPTGETIMLKVAGSFWGGDEKIIVLGKT